MTKFRNTLFAALFALVLCGPGMVFAAQKAGIPVPWEATGRSAQYLTGGISEPNVKANLSWEGVSSGALQGALEEEVEDHIPFKGTVMLGNAAWQRRAIELADAPFDWPLYPTYFGSDVYYEPAGDVLARKPSSRSKASLEELEEIGADLAGLAARHPDKRFFVYVVQGNDDPDASLGSILIANPVQPYERIEALDAGLQGAQNVTTLTYVYDTMEGYYEEFYCSDHHWNWRGARRAYQIIAEAAELEEAPEAQEVEVEGPPFIGSLGREGLMLVAEPPTDSGIDFSNLTVRFKDGHEGAYSHEKYASDSDRYRPYSFYSSYYDFLGRADSIAGPGEGTALVVTNSNGSVILPYIAENYAETYISQQLRDDMTDPNATLEGLIEQCGAQDIYFVSKAVNYQHAHRTAPEFYK